MLAQDMIDVLQLIVANFGNIPVVTGMAGGIGYELEKFEVVDAVAYASTAEQRRPMLVIDTRIGVVVCTVPKD